MAAPVRNLSGVAAVVSARQTPGLALGPSSSGGLAGFPPQCEMPGPGRDACARGREPQLCGCGIGRADLSPLVRVVVIQFAAEQHAPFRLTSHTHIEAGSTESLGGNNAMLGDRTRCGFHRAGQASEFDSLLQSNASQQVVRRQDAQEVLIVFPGHQHGHPIPNCYDIFHRVRRLTCSGS